MRKTAYFWNGEPNNLEN